MKKYLLCFFIVAFISAFVFATDSVEGFWISVDEKSGEQTAGWEIWQEDGLLNGKILAAADVTADETAGGKGKSYDNFQNGVDVNTVKVIGTTWIWGLTKKNPGQWENGFIIDPENGSRYKCKITFHKADGKKYTKDTLEMRGELGPFGRSQFWHQATKEEALAIK
jgi:uncharacterized protein (DUF2147 family)